MRETVKKGLYYGAPFLLVPGVLLLCEWMDDAGVVKMSPYILGTVLLLLSVVAGWFSPAAGRFDAAVTAVMPLSLFVCMWIGGFLDRGDLGSRFRIDRAFAVAFQPISLILYALMALAAFGASWAHFRKGKVRKNGQGR